MAKDKKKEIQAEEAAEEVTETVEAANDDNEEPKEA